MESNGFSAERAIEGGGTKLLSAMVAAARQLPRRGRGQGLQTLIRSEKRPANAGIGRSS
jgi:hypothetical protein